MTHRTIPPPRRRGEWQSSYIGSGAALISTCCQLTGGLREKPSVSPCRWANHGAQLHLPRGASHPSGAKELALAATIPACRAASYVRPRNRTAGLSAPANLCAGTEALPR